MKRFFRKLGDMLINGAAHLPLGVLYVFSDFCYFLLFYVFRYRRKVAEKNLRESFPEAGDDEINGILKKFYLNFTDYTVETLKLAHISDEEMMRRMTFEGTELMDDAVAAGRSVVVYFSHCFNWEWAPSVTLHSRFKDDKNVIFAQVYRPLKSEWFDGVMLRLRSRFGSESFKKSTVLRDLLKLRMEKKVWVTGFMSDQKPSHGDPTYIVKFLNHPTAAITGTETLAMRLKTTAIYWDMQKISRGHYNIVMRKIADDASTMQKNDVTQKYVELLENTIRRQPDIWLWTHKRWKIPVKFPEQSPENETDSSNNP